MRKILVVDDEYFEREVLKIIINGSGQDFVIIGEAENGLEAIDFIEKNQVDIVLMDIRMPKLDGIEATRRIKEKHPNVVIIMITAYAEFDLAYNALKLHVDDYLLKPSRPKTVMDSLNSAEKIIASRIKQEKKQSDFKSVFRRNFINGDYIETKKLLKEISKINYISIEDEIGDMKELLEITCVAAEHYKIDLGKNSRSEIIHKLKNLHKKDQYYVLIGSLIDDIFDVIVNNKLAVYSKEMDYVIQYIEKNIAKKITLEDAAKYMNISIHYFSKLFKSEIGINFIDYITDRKIHRAQQFIEETDIPISTIAYELGFNEANYFSKVFKTKLGVSPSEYRREKTLGSKESANLLLGTKKVRG